MSADGGAPPHLNESPPPVERDWGLELSPPGRARAVRFLRAGAAIARTGSMSLRTNPAESSGLWASAEVLTALANHLEKGHP